MITLEQKQAVIKYSTYGIKNAKIAQTESISTNAVRSILNDKIRLLATGDWHCGHVAGLPLLITRRMTTKQRFGIGGLTKLRSLSRTSCLLMEV